MKLYVEEALKTTQRVIKENIGQKYQTKEFSIPSEFPTSYFILKKLEDKTLTNFPYFTCLLQKTLLQNIPIQKALYCLTSLFHSPKILQNNHSSKNTTKKSKAKISFPVRRSPRFKDSIKTSSWSMGRSRSGLLYGLICSLLNVPFVGCCVRR